MHLILDIFLTLLSIFIVGIHGMAGKTHFKSRAMPDGARLLVVAVLTTLVVFLVLLWTNDAPIGAQIAALALEALSLWLFYRTIAASRDGALHLAFDIDNPVSLVTSGPYRYVRHPFYTSYLIFWSGLALGTWSLWSIAVLAVMVVLYTVAARGEEVKFAKTEMSGDYATYRSRTGMFWPKLG